MVVFPKHNTRRFYNFAIYELKALTFNILNSYMTLKYIFLNYMYKLSEQQKQQIFLPSQCKYV